MNKNFFIGLILVSLVFFGLDRGACAAVSIPELPAEGAEEQLELYIDAANHGAPRAMLTLAHYNEYGIGMPTNRAEALRWYQKVLAASSGSTKELVEAAEDGVARLGGDMLQLDVDSTCGNYYLDLIASQTNRESAFSTFNILRTKLLDTTLVFTNLISTYVNRRKDGVVILRLEVPNECRKVVREDPHAFFPYDYPFMSTFFIFEGEDAKLAERIDRDDRIVSIEGQVCTNRTGHGGLVLKGISFEPKDKSVNDPLPDFNAETISGDELIDYIRGQRHVRKWQFFQIQSKLAGRRLTFHNLRLAGSSGSFGQKFDSTFWVGAVPKWERVGEGDIVGSAFFKLSFSTDAARRFARNVNRMESFALLDEVTGTFSVVEDPSEGWAFQLEDVNLVPKGSGLDVTVNSEGVLPGDEIVRKVGRNFTPLMKLGLCSRFAGQKIAFTSGVVTSCRTDWTSNTVSIVCRMVSDDREGESRNLLQVSFTIPPSETKNLRRTPVPGDLVVGLKGRLADVSFDEGKGRDRYDSWGSRSASSVLELEDPEFSITWMSDVAKTTGLDNKTGERIVRRVGLCFKEVRKDQFLRLAQQVNGREVDFVRGRVRNVLTQGDGTVLVTVGLEDPLLGECAELILVVPAGKFAEQVAVLKHGTRIMNIHGVLKVELGRLNNWEPETMSVRLLDSTFEIAPPPPRRK